MLYISAMGDTCPTTPLNSSLWRRLYLPKSVRSREKPVLCSSLHKEMFFTSDCSTLAVASVVSKPHMKLPPWSGHNSTGSKQILSLYSAIPHLCNVRILFCTCTVQIIYKILDQKRDNLSWTYWPVICQLLWPALTFQHLLVVCTDQIYRYLLLTFSCRNSTTCVSQVNTPRLLVGGNILGNLGMIPADWLPTLFWFNGKGKKNANKLAKDWGHTNAHTCIQMNGEEFKLMRWHTQTHTRPVSHPNTCVQRLAHKLIGHPISNLLSLSL